MTERFDDDVISAVLDGEADEETRAAVLADPAARRRLEALRSVQALVATPPPPADSERRAASIAAALAEAQTAPEVTSLAPARSTRTQRWRPPVEWVAAAAAVLVAVLAIPLIGSLGGDDDDTSITAADSAEMAEAGSDAGLSSRAADSALLADDDAAAEEAAPATTALASQDPTADADAGDVGGATDGADEATSADDVHDAGDAEADFADPARAPTVVNSTAVLDSFLVAGIIGPEYFATDPEIVETVNPTCLEPFAGDDGEVFALALVTPTAGPNQVVVVHFADDGTTTTLDAEDCSPVG